MKIFKMKTGQTIVEFVLIFALVGLIGGVAFLKLNPNLFKNYFKASVSSSSKTIDSNGQMELCGYDDDSCNAVAATSPPPTSSCLNTTAIGGTQTDGTIYAGDNLCTTADNLPVQYTWNSGSGFPISTSALSTTNGKANTDLLEMSTLPPAGPYKAAKACSDLVSNGHNDWYLPAREELGTLFNNRCSLTNVDNKSLWSSTQYSSNNAYYYYFASGQTTFSSSYKTDFKYVRCVRHD